MSMETIDVNSTYLGQSKKDVVPQVKCHVEVDGDRVLVKTENQKEYIFSKTEVKRMFESLYAD